MKRFLLLALCALFACNAEARTLYVDASQPNNDGNGLSRATAKKTIQAAINASKKGDTILVCPGAYSPIKTNNKKISIKATGGANGTGILKSADTNEVVVLAQLASFSVSVLFGNDPTPDEVATKLTGFRIDGMKTEGAFVSALSGGSVRSCVIQNLVGDLVACGSDVRDSTIRGNDCSDTMMEGCYLSRCKLVDNTCSGTIFGHGAMANCLVARNTSLGSRWFFDGTTFGGDRLELVNCTIVGNRMYTVFFNWVVEGRETPPFLSYRTAFRNCILRNNHFAGEARETVHNVDSRRGNKYVQTFKNNRNPKFVNAAKSNFRLKKGSPCIDTGKLTKAQKKLVGTKDLAGRKRIKGKAIDRGCYER